MTGQARSTVLDHKALGGAAIAFASMLALTAGVLAQADVALPTGPKEALATVVGDDPAALDGLLGRTLDAEGWRQELGASGADETAVAVLADYLALNGPFDVATGGSVADTLALMPLDGKQLFLGACLACHGGDRYFLKQEKSMDEWMGIFDAPYHRRLLTEGVERESFASYAAAVTPVDLAEVPPELQDAR